MLLAELLEILLVQAPGRVGLISFHAVVLYFDDGGVLVLVKDGADRLALVQELRSRLASDQ